MRMYILFHHVFVLCIQAFYPVSYVSELFTLFPILFFVYLCVHAFTLFHHIAMFMYPSYLHYFTILYVMCPSFLSCFLCVRTFYSISHTFFVYLCVHAFTLFHHIAMFMYPSYLHYFTILICYVSKLFILFPMCQDFLLYFTISFMYVYVSKLFILFPMCQDFLLYFTILFLYVMCPSFLSCFLCVRTFYSISPYYYVFMYPCFCTISPYILIIYVMYPYYSHYFTT